MKRYLPDLIGTKAIVTGAARGVGKGIASVLRAAGARVNEVDVNPIKKSVFSTVADIGSPDDCDRLVDATLERLGHINLLVNNAAIWSDCSLWEGTPAQWLTTMQVNLVGTLYLTRRVAGEMIAAGIKGSIIFITSIHERTPRRWHFDYPASKAAQRALVQELALELAPFGIRVNAIAPGHIENRPEQVAQGKREQNPFVPLGGLSGIPEDIGRVAAVLASSDLTGYMTGANITVDGGLSLHNH